MKNLVLFTAVIALVGCNPNSNNGISGNFEPKIIAAAASPDYATADVIVIGEDDTVLEQQVHNTDPSDIQIALQGFDIYRLGRYQSDNITKVEFDSETNELSLDWQYSVLGDDSSANPHDIAFVSNTSAYVSRGDAVSLWHINPSATNEDDFLLEEIDLSAYATSDNGIPNMTDLQIVGDELYVLLQEINADFSAAVNSQILVLDTTDNSVIDVDSVTGGTQTIALPVRNGAGLSLVGTDLYVVAAGDQSFTATDDSKYTGGVVLVDTTDYSTELVIDDGTAGSAPYGQITNVAVNADGDIYFTGNASWGDDSLFFKESGSSNVTEISIGDATAYNISDIKIDGSELYVAVFTQDDGSENAGLKVVDTASNTLTKLIETTYNPTQLLVIE